MAIIYSSCGVDFVQAYCRKAMIDRWGMFCADPFRRASDAALTRSWAEPIGRSLFLFRPTRFEIVPEREWMRQAKRETVRLRAEPLLARLRCCAMRWVDVG